MRAEAVETFNTGSNFSVISAMGLNGVYESLMIEGAIDGEVFQQYVAQSLVQELRPGDIVIMDNVPFHYNSKAIRLIEATGARVMYLPAYSPDFNPIENCISKLKTFLRGAKACTERKLQKALAKALELITIKDIYGWFNHCGYTCPSI